MYSISSLPAYARMKARSGGKPTQSAVAASLTTNKCSAFGCRNSASSTVRAGSSGATTDEDLGMLPIVELVRVANTNGTSPITSRYSAITLTPSSGLISTVRDLAKFDLAIRKGVQLRAETLALAWSAPTGAGGQRLPHGMGWFVQSYNGEPIVWQFGVSDNGSSSMILTAPFRGLTLILLANSSGLARPFSLEAGDVTVSPFARLFLGIFVR